MDDIELLKERKTYFRMTARVQLRHLQFDLEGDPVRKCEVSRMIDIYSFYKCQRLVPENFIQAIIRQEDLNQAQLSQPDETSFPELILPINFKLPCLHGKHRISAAQEVLEPG